MNIIKIKNITSIKSSNIIDKLPVPEGEEKRYDFRNKYCYAIHLNWIVPMNPGGLDDLAEEDIPSYEQVCGLLEEDYKLVEQMNDESLESFFLENNIAYKRLDESLERYVDILKSPMSRLNLDFYYTENDRSDIGRNTPGIKRYRAYVAKFLLQDINKYKSTDILEPRKIVAPCPKKVAMLIYYAFDMIEDKVLQTLQMLQPADTINNHTCEIPITTTSKTGCMCQSSGLTDLSSISTEYNCDMVRMYRISMKNVMIETFTDLNFWRWFIYNTPTGESGSIAKIYDYTEALIKSGLSIFNRDGVPKIDLNNPCGNVNVSEFLYKQYLDDLNIILRAFELMKEGVDIFESNISYIQDAMNRFVKYYEYLQWEKLVVDFSK